MATLTIDKFGDLDAGFNDIGFQGAKSAGNARQICRDYWGEVKGSVMVTYQGKTFVCDGIDPTTGKPFSAEVAAQLREAVDSYLVL